MNPSSYVRRVFHLLCDDAIAKHGVRQLYPSVTVAHSAEMAKYAILYRLLIERRFANISDTHNTNFTINFTSSRQKFERVTVIAGVNLLGYLAVGMDLVLLANNKSSSTHAARRTCRSPPDSFLFTLSER